MLEKFFKLKENGTDMRTEILAGVTTFLTMVYIVFVNPSILADAGMDKGAVFVATCLAAAIGTLLMGLLANYPIALAPGMGINAFFAYGIVLGMGHTWQVALGAVFVSGVIFVALSVLPVRHWIVNSIPQGLKMAISAGIGLFLAIIALKNGGVIVDNPATLVGLGDVKSASVIMFAFGFFLIAGLYARQITGSIVIGILAVTIISAVLGYSSVSGIVSAPPSMAPTYMELDIAGALEIGLITIIFALLFVDLFDTAGTLVAVAHKGKMLDKDGKLPRLKKALLADSTASVAGSVFGTSTTTSYIESAAGVGVGGRTGLTAVTVAVLFILALFFSPLAGAIPPYATAPAILFVACLMATSLKEVNWDDITEYVPAAVIVISMPLTFSIAEGIGLGFLTYVLVKLLAGRSEDLTGATYLITGLFVLRWVIV